MSDEISHECGVAMVVLKRPPSATGDYGGTKLSLLMEKQHNRGQDGAGAAILAASPEPGEAPYWVAKSASATPLADVLAAIGGRRAPPGRVFLGHLRYATFGKNDEAFCHPFVHEASELEHTLLLAGNFNLTNTAELFENYRRQGEFPTSRADGYLICEMVAHELKERHGGAEYEVKGEYPSPQGHPIASALSKALANADGAWTLCGATGNGWAFATRDPHGIRPGWYYVGDDVVAVASERPAIQAAFDVPPDAVKELPPGEALLVSPDGDVEFRDLGAGQATDGSPSLPAPDVSHHISSSCSFERIYFSRANDADIHRERKSLGAALVPQILEAADAPMEDIFFSYIPNSARIAFHGLLERLFTDVFSTGLKEVGENSSSSRVGENSSSSRVGENSSSSRVGENSSSSRKDLSTIPLSNSNSNSKLQLKLPRFGEIAVKDAKFRTFIANAASRKEFYKHVYDVTYGLIRPGLDTLVVLDDSIVRGSTMKNAILPMLDRLGPKRIVVASSAPPIRYPDCYGIDMSTLGELVAFRALVNLLGEGAEKELKTVPLASLYSRFTDAEHCAEIARLLTTPGMKAEVKVVFQTVGNLRRCLGNVGDWYFTGDYPTPGGFKVLAKALANFLAGKGERSY